jgi:putative hemolysin
MNSKTNIIQIDVKQLFKEKNPKLYRFLPGFFFRYLRKIVHEKQLNYILKTHGHKNGIDFLNSTLDYFDASAETIEQKHLPKHTKIIIAANHPLGSIDGMLLIKKVFDHYGKAKALVNDMLMTLEPLQEFFIGFNKHGSTARQTIKELNTLLEKDCPIIYFPSGMVSRRYNGVIKDPEWKKTFVNNAVQYEREVVPIHISGHLSESFYRKASIRRFFGIGMNIEMLYLPDELFKLEKPCLKLTVGKPIPYEQFDKSKTAPQWAEEVRKHVYTLAKNPNAEFKAS